MIDPLREGALVCSMLEVEEGTRSEGTINEGIVEVQDVFQK
jgi:hypothetical protein